jgi:hypothetical protein
MQRQRRENTLRLLCFSSASLRQSSWLFKRFLRVRRRSMGQEDRVRRFRRQSGQFGQARLAIAGVDQLEIQSFSWRGWATAQILSRVIAHQVLNPGDAAGAPVIQSKPEGSSSRIFGLPGAWAAPHPAVAVRVVLVLGHGYDAWPADLPQVLSGSQFLYRAAA